MYIPWNWLRKTERKLQSLLSNQCKVVFYCNQTSAENQDWLILIGDVCPTDQETKLELTAPSSLNDLYLSTCLKQESWRCTCTDTSLTVMFSINYILYLSSLNFGTVISHTVRNVPGSTVWCRRWLQLLHLFWLFDCFDVCILNVFELMFHLAI